MLLSQIKHFVLLFFLLVFISCSEKSDIIEKDNVVAKVNKSALTREALNNFNEKSKYNKKFRQEIINEWIEKELLYNEANDEGITASSEFHELVNQSKKELASAIYLQKYFENNLKQVTESEMQSYYIKYREDFRLKDNAFIINQIKFSSIEKANQFRDEAVSNSWIRAVNLFTNDGSVKKFDKDLFLFRYQIQPLRLLKSLEEMKPDEISNVIQVADDVYTIIHLMLKFDAGTIPEFEVVKSDVEKRYNAKLKKDLYRKLIAELGEKYKVELNEENIK